jgi:hypothetical protein
LIRPRAAALAVGSAFGAVALMSLAQLTQPEVTPSWRPPSELALGPTGWAMTAGFVLLGLACLLLFAALRGQAATLPARIGRCLLLAGALGGIVAGVFPTDPWNATELSATGMAHSAAPMLLNGVPIASIILGVSLARRSAGWRTHRRLLIAGSVLVVGAAVALSASMAAMMPAGGGLGPDVTVGWQARVLLLAEALWVAVAAGCALAVRRGSAPDTVPTGTTGTAVTSYELSGTAR